MPRGMGDIHSPSPVKLIVGMLSSRREWLDQAVGRMRERFGPVDVAGEPAEFTFTHYYDQEMGSSLLRQFLAFERLIDPGDIVQIKQFTNALEDEFSCAAKSVAGVSPALLNGPLTRGRDARDTADPRNVNAPPPRPINLDPGYVCEGKLVLASTKDFSHRVYLGGGIYAEVTLMYGQGRWLAQKYTFPDYAAGAYDAFLTAARQALRRQLGRKERPA